MMIRKSQVPARNILTFEVEDAFHVDSPDFEPADAKSRTIPNLIHLLDILDGHKTRATFFILGWVASKFPEIVSLLDSRGHEIACHGYSHGDITKMDLEKFESETRRSKELLENIIKKSVLGFKGACNPLEKKHVAILGEISKAGFKYDCSTKAGIFAGKSSEPFVSRFKDGQSIIIIPQSAVGRWGVWLRFGEKLRLYPLSVTRWAIRYLNRRGYPAMINMKLWEIDKYQIRSPRSDYLQYRRYGNLNLAEEKLLRILDIFEFTTCAEALGLEY